MNKPSAYSYAPIHLLSVLRRRPQASADIQGNESYPDISGAVRFYQTDEGVIVCAEINGLPHSGQPCQERVFGFHIHEGGSCTGDLHDPYSNAMSHYNPGGCAHPCHAGDLPPLFGNEGFALSLFLTNRFAINEVIGKTIIIHDRPDDFTTQPSGNSGEKIACGVIRKPIPYCL